ncbi:hypothetical protein E2C01_092152 [Portunus trituberculatus]|uniref:Uncharacterized protein n=1 Tax=Portunus trituberculatus TaxID=210409 RepID=A0A5B7JKV0_PORTR|nr:hypothetical protein [Portunus trituberculatus]
MVAASGREKKTHVPGCNTTPFDPVTPLCRVPAPRHGSRRRAWLDRRPGIPTPCLSLPSPHTRTLPYFSIPSPSRSALSSPRLRRRPPDTTRLRPAPAPLRHSLRRLITRGSGGVSVFTHGGVSCGGGGGGSGGGGCGFLIHTFFLYGTYEENIS